LGEVLSHAIKAARRAKMQQERALRSRVRCRSLFATPESATPRGARGGILSVGMAAGQFEGRFLQLGERKRPLRVREVQKRNGFEKGLCVPRRNVSPKRNGHGTERRLLA